MAIWNLANKHSLELKISSHELKHFNKVHTKSIRNAVWSLNETEIVSASFDETAALTDIQSGLCLFSTTYLIFIHLLFKMIIITRQYFFN
jgi:WD40 repeat protein